MRGVPARRGSGQATKRRESALLAGTIRGATCLGARGRISPPQYKPKGAKQMPNELVKQISYILYKADEEDVKVNALLKDESIWLTQNSMAELLDVNVPAVSKHLKNIYECGELDEASTISILETVQKEGTRSVKRNVTFYNLDAIISVGYRVNSAKEIRK